MLRLGEPQKLIPMRGERNYLVYIPLGVGRSDSTWNFPVRHHGGNHCGFVGYGEYCVLKPASDSPTIAAKFIDILLSGHSEGSG